MLYTLKATLSPSGTLTFDEPVRIARPVAVLVTLLDESSATQPIAVDSDPLAWSLSDQEQAVWDDLPDFRAEHPVRLGSLEHPI
jgi:hypothetical protein